MRCTSFISRLAKQVRYVLARALTFSPASFRALYVFNERNFGPQAQYVWSEETSFHRIEKNQIQSSLILDIAETAAACAEKILFVS